MYLFSNKSAELGFVWMSEILSGITLLLRARLNIFFSGNLYYNNIGYFIFISLNLYFLKVESDVAKTTYVESQLQKMC